MTDPAMKTGLNVPNVIRCGNAMHIAICSGYRKGDADGYYFKQWIDS